MKYEDLVKPVAGFDGYYVGRCGCVYGPKGLLSPSRKNNKGYVKYTLSGDAGLYEVTGHRLVVMTFYGDIPDGFQVNHLNGDKTDNRLDNLEVVTQNDNMAHAVENGLITGSRVIGTHIDGTKKVFSSMNQAAKEVGSTRQHIRKFANGSYHSGRKYDKKGWNWSYHK